MKKLVFLILIIILIPYCGNPTNSNEDSKKEPIMFRMVARGDIEFEQIDGEINYYWEGGIVIIKTNGRNVEIVFEGLGKVE